MGVVSSTDGRDQERDLPASIAAGPPEHLGPTIFKLAVRLPDERAELLRTEIRDANGDDFPTLVLIEDP